MVEWPQERRHRLSNPMTPGSRLAEIPESDLLDGATTETFRSLVHAIVDGSSTKGEPKTLLAELSARLQSNDFLAYGENVRDALLAFACVDALRQTPTREMWEFLWSLAWHSSSLANLLPQAVVFSSTDIGFKSTFLHIARDVVQHALENPGRRAIARDKEIAVTLREHWQKHPRLSTLWRNNFSRGFHAVGNDDDNVLSIVADIDTTEFILLLQIFDYPDPVAHALTRCGAGWRFEHWRAMVAAAPTSFGEEGRWNGSLILPILLAIAREQFQFPIRNDATDAQISDATTEIVKLASEVARAVAQRADASACTMRWGAWLMRDAIRAVSANAVPQASDAKSQGFIDLSLFDALVSEAPTGRWRAEVPPDAELWEPWCHLAAGVSVAISRKAPVPSPSGFLADWELSPESWSSSAGQTLKARAVPFEMGVSRADGYGARLIALSVVETESANDSWARFWRATATLREIIEFGDVDEIDVIGWQGRSDASRLLMLQFSVGLMMLDHLILPQRTLPYPRRSAMEGLLPLLDEAVREMTAIDQLNGKFWIEANRHLAIRRATWLSGGGAQQFNAEVVALDPKVKPTLADFIRQLAGDTEGLLNLVHVAVLNHVERSALVDAFREADVDLAAEIEIAKRLLEISPRAASLRQAQLDSASKLLPVA